jgi:ElaB/YqjD/DUF883 family membrane-anchored ribosome-binding protein
MAMDHETKSSAELEREVAAQRSRVEDTIGELQRRLSPGQLVDEVLSYAKDGGGQFVGNFGKTISANPLPAALLGVSLVWLMAGGKSGPAAQAATGSTEWGRNGWAGSNTWDRGKSYPYATVRGSGLKRIGHAADEAGEWFSEWADDAGTTYKAKADKMGRRAGHFVDDTGKMFSGFIDEAGNRVEHFRDEAGNLIEEAGDWASHAWDDMRHAVSRNAQGVMQAASHLGGDVQVQADKMTQQVMSLFKDQPLIAGALAFAAGAAIGAVLPHTEQEDQALGEMADQVKREASHVAADLYEKGKEQAAELYDEASEKVGEVYEQAKSTLTNAVQTPSGQARI